MHSKTPWTIGTATPANVAKHQSVTINKPVICVNAFPGHSVALCGSAENNDDIEIVKANARLIAQAPAMLEVMQEFVDRCDKGEVRSVKTYAKFKSIINAINTAE